MNVICLLHVVAQKKPLTHDVYDEWKDIASPTISNNGEYVLYEINPAQGDGILYLHNTKQSGVSTYPRGTQPAFTNDNQFAIFQVAPPYDTVRNMKLEDKKAEELPKDSLYVLELESGEFMGEFERVKSYRLPEKGNGWLAFLYESPLDTADNAKEDSTKSDTDGGWAVLADKPDKPEGNELVILHLETQKEWHYERVSNYLFSEDGSQLAFTQVAGDSVGSAGVMAFNTQSQTLVPVDTGKVSYEQLSLSQDGQSIAFLASEDSLKADDRYFNLYLWNEDQASVASIADTTTQALPSGWMVSTHGSVSFSHDGQRLFFETAPRPVAYAYEEDTTVLDDERVKVDIWSWQDPYIQPMQLEQRESEQNRSYTAVYDISEQQVRQLGTEELPDIQLDEDKRLGYAIGISDLPYRKQISWDYPFHRDAYLLDISTGESSQIVTNTTGYPQLSPGGSYAYWYDASDSSWYAYEIASQQTTNLTKKIDANFYDELNDVPALPGSYGMAGWTENDEHILLYDYYDIWKVNPKNQEFSNLTNGYGRENHLEFRYEQLDPDEYFIPASGEILLSAFNRENKQSGYFREHTGNNRSPEKLLMDDYRFYGLQKAKESEDVIYRKSSFVEFPDLWLSTTDFKNAEELSEANPQQADYLWGTVELVSWQSVDGTPLEGMLYKPEGFDPSQKYPMMVYFYERNSDNLHRHIAPEPHRSTINFTFYTSRGYLVFVPDIVYKEGYPGESALNAVMSGTLHVMEEGFVDNDRVGMQGHSWGGYQSAYIITRSNLFRAAEAGAPVANMTSAYGGIRWGTGMSRMFQYERTQSRIGGSLWEYPLRYIENSPIFMADKIETPLLILHNDHDTAVPWEQGIELFVALRRLNKPVWMLNYNDEPHWPLKYPNRKDFARRMQQFFDHYLKDEPMPIWMEEGVPATLKGRTLRYEMTSEDTQKP
uniref:Prolyl oligopeptidase family serine peptidase n=1 Tax=Roseihalotalea indica TaxID=2867963 RepID=A0AA49GQJ9_9BACT|nr:prolyl oligopeptidase family serine peptidase [Tunicatimonas sp. TK19036]